MAAPLHEQYGESTVLDLNQGPDLRVLDAHVTQVIESERLQHSWIAASLNTRLSGKAKRRNLSLNQMLRVLRNPQVNRGPTSYDLEALVTRTLQAHPELKATPIHGSPQGRDIERQARIGDRPPKG